MRLGKTGVYLSVSIGRARSNFISLSHSRLLAMTNARFCLVRPVSLSNWLMSVVAGRLLKSLPCFDSQRSSWQTVLFLLLHQWPLNYSRRIWRLVEIGGKAP